MKEFLHKIDLDKLSQETGLTMDQIASMAGIAEARNLKKWTHDKGKGGVRPVFNTMVKLIQSGATVETLFGVEYKAAVKVVERPMSKDEFMKGVREALADIGREQSSG